MTKTYWNSTETIILVIRIIEIQLPEAQFPEAQFPEAQLLSHSRTLRHYLLFPPITQKSQKTSQEFSKSNTKLHFESRR